MANVPEIFASFFDPCGEGLLSFPDPDTGIVDLKNIVQLLFATVGGEDMDVTFLLGMSLPSGLPT